MEEFMAIRKSVITIEVNNIIYYSMDNKGRTWSDEINDAKQHRGMANAKYRQIKEYLEDQIQVDPNNKHELYIKANGSFFSGNKPTTTISYNEAKTVELHELFLSI
jgi:hypothetical protein